MGDSLEFSFGKVVDRGHLQWISVEQIGTLASLVDQDLQRQAQSASKILSHQSRAQLWTAKQKEADRRQLGMDLGSVAAVIDTTKNLQSPLVHRFDKSSDRLVEGVVAPLFYQDIGIGQKQ